MKITKLQKGLASWVLLAGGILLLPVAQAQVYLPGQPAVTARSPGSDVDPDLYNTFTDSGATNRTSPACGGADGATNECVGGFMHRLGNPRVNMSGSELVFEWQIKAAQSTPTDIKTLEDFLRVSEGVAINLLGRSRLNLYFNTNAFGLGIGNTADNWGPECVATNGRVLQAIEALGALTYSAGADGLLLGASNTQALNNANLAFFGPQFNPLIIPHDRYMTVATIACPIISGDEPAKLAFQAVMMQETARRVAVSGVSDENDVQRAASIPANNLWYYPLDGAPAIIDAELGAGGEQAYLDLTFSAPVAVSPQDGAGVFDGAIHLAGMSDFDTGAPTATSATLTVSGVTHLSTTLLRLHLDADLREISADLQEISEDTTPNFIFIIPPEEGIQGLDGDRLHTGDDWRLAVFFDHEAPYITEAVVTEESRSIVITFSEPVQFGLEFDASNASIPSVVFPAPATADFVLVRRSSTGSFIDEFPPAGVMFAESPLLASSGITTLTLEMPTDRGYLPSETVDVRIAERLKDPAHPSLASVFDFVDDDVNFKDSKFGVGPSNFPRTAAPAQVSGLQLRGREYTLVASVPEGPVATGDPSTLTFTLTGSKPLVPGDTVRVSFVTPTGFGEAPESITFDANSTETEVIWTPDSTALDASGQPPVFTVDVEPSIEATGPISVELNAGSTARFVLERTFRVAVLPVEPAHYDIRGVSTKTITLGLTGTGAQLVPGDSTLNLVFGLEKDGELLLQSQMEISVSSEDTDSVTVPSQSTLLVVVVLTPEKSTATFAIAVTDPALAATDLLLVAENIPSSVSFVYEGTDDGVCGNRSDCVATVSAAGGRPFTLDFQSASGEFIDVLQLTSGQSTSVMLVFGMSPGDTLNEDESVEVELALADTTEPRVTVSQMLVTFDSTSTTSEVELGVSGDAPSGTFLLQIMRTTVTQGAENERMLIDLPTSEWPVLAAEVRPVVDFIPDLDKDGNIADRFVDAVDSLAPGAIATTVTNAGRPYILVPGIGVETVINAAALLEDNFSPSLGVCVVSVMRGEDSIPATPPAPPAKCDFLSRLLAENTNTNIPVSPYRSVLFWVGLSADGTVATDAGGAPIQVGDPQVVYIAPPVGFKPSFWVYDSINTEVVLPLGIGVEAIGDILPSIALGLDLPVGGSIVLDLPVRDDEDGYEYEYDPDLARILTESTEIRITKVEGVAFIAFLDGTGRPSDDGLVRELVGDETLFSLGNDRVTLVPPSDMEGLHDGPLPTSNMEGSDDGPFPANTPKIIDFEPGSDVTIYRYSSENRAFKMLGQANSVISVTIKASTGLVVIETLPEGATLTELRDFTYPSTSSSIFEIVVSLASTEEVEDPADGTTSNKMVTRTSNIRTFAVDSFPLSKGEAGAFTDGASTVTMVGDDEIEGGPYATYSGGGSSVFADADLFPALPDMVGGVFDYVVTGEPSLEGGRAAVVIKLDVDLKVAAGLRYHVYQRQSDEEWGWAPFVVDDANRIYSAPKPCPALSASREAVVPERDRVYAWGLAHEGLGTDHRCVLVEFSDGGMNDADQTANAFAYSTGAFAQSDVVVNGGGNGGVEVTPTFTLDFQSAGGDSIVVLPLTSGQSASVYLVFSTSPEDALNMGESVEVELALEGTPHVTVSPMLVTFDSNSTTSKVELSVSEDAPAGTFMLQVAEATLIRDSGKRTPIMSASQLLAMPVKIEVRPVVDFIPDLDKDGNIADRFVDAVDSLAPGAIATTVTNAGRPYILVPGIGVETVINAAALLEDNFSPSLGVCVVSVMRGEDSIPATPPAPPAKCDFLSRLLAENTNTNIPVSPYRSVLFWVGLSADGTVATDAGGAPIQVGDPQVVYIAPPVGFKPSFWVYDSINTEVVLPLGIGVEAIGDILPSIALGLDLPVGGSIVLDLPVRDDEDGYEYEYDPDLARILTESTEIRITKVEGVAFIAFLDGTGRQSDDDVRTLVENDNLFSLGNDRVTLVPQALVPTSDMEGLHDGPLPTRGIEGSDDGPFPANTPKIIDFEPGSDVTIYRYSSENRAFKMLGQANSVISVTIKASTGLVVIETLPEGATLTELRDFTYPSTSSSIFEIVVSLASTEEVEDPADGTTSNKMVTRTSNIRTFAVDSFPLSKGEAGAFTDGASTVTMVGDDEIEGGPYATYSGGGSSVFADADLFPALPDMVGGVFDYVVTGEPSLEGGRAAVVIELDVDLKVAAGLRYHVYQRQSDEEWGWAPFVVDDANRIYSAPKPCPALSASREAVVPERDRVYAWGLAHEGLGTDHRCVLVEFSDGGMNDADQTANAFAYSTGAFATQSDGDGDSGGGGGGNGGGGGGGGAVALVWLLALTLIVLLAGAGNRRRRATRAD